MPKTKAQKQNILESIAENLNRQQSVLFVDYKGIGVKDLAQLRKRLKEVGAKLHVAKKTLLQKAFKEQGMEQNFSGMEGQIALVYSFQDPIAGVKATHTFARGREDIKLLGGYMENRALDALQIAELAQLPSKEQLLAMFVGTLAAPMRGFVKTLDGNLKGLMFALKAIAEKKH